MLHKIRPLGWPALRTVRTCDADGRERKGMIMWICTQISVYHFRARHASSAGQAACQAPQSARFFQSIFTIAGRVLRLKLKSLMRIDFTENLWKLRGLYSHPKETHFMNEKFCWWHLLVKVHPVRRGEAYYAQPQLAQPLCKIGVTFLLCTGAVRVGAVHNRNHVSIMHRYPPAPWYHCPHLSIDK